MSTTEQDQQNNVKYVFNFFNIPQPNTSNNNNVTDPKSPTPSVLSENSIECSLSGHNMASDAASSCSDESEQELTNLTWLTELRNQSLTWPDSVHPIDDDSHDKKSNGGKSANKLPGKSAEENVSIQQKRPTPTERYETFLDKIKKDKAQYDMAAEVYQTDVGEKPPFNYSHIIGMAMVENGRMTLQQICSWIEAKFAFFRVRKKWNNSIRHNLSLHHCFRKIDRSKYEKGKGGYWELGIDPTKCDRKRIRNRKTMKSRSPLAETKDKRQIREVYTDKQDYQMTLSTPADQSEEFFLDELDVQQNIVIPKEPREATINEEFVSPTSDNSRLDHQYDMNDPIQLQDVFIADIGNCGKVVNSSNMSVSGEYQLGTIIVNSSAADNSGPSLNISAIQQQMNVFVEDEIPQPCENVVISSYLSNDNHGNQGQPNVIVEQMEPYYTVSTDNNFRPYIDGIDETFQYLRSMDNRCEDLFDNLLDISVSDY